MSDMADIEARNIIEHYGSCPNNSLYANQFPHGWNTNPTQLCALGFPLYEPLKNLSACCDTKVTVVHGCLQICQPKNANNFHSCAQQHVFDNSDVNGWYGVTECNNPSSQERGPVIGAGGRLQAGEYGASALCLLMMLVYTFF